MTNPTNDAKPKSTYSGIVPAVEEASRVMITLARNNPGKMTLTQIRKEVGIHNSKAFSILNTLQKFGFVQKDSVTKTYSLGMGLIFLSQKVLETLDLREVASPFLSRLSSGTNSTAFSGINFGQLRLRYGQRRGKPNGGSFIQDWTALSPVSGALTARLYWHSCRKKSASKFWRTMVFLFVVTGPRST